MSIQLYLYYVNNLSINFNLENKNTPLNNDVLIINPHKFTILIYLFSHIYPIL